MKKIFFVLIIVLLNSSIFGQVINDEVYIISENIPTNQHEADIYRIKVIHKTSDKKIELLEISNYREDFNLLCSVYEKDGTELLLFKNFDSITGSTKYYYIDINTFIVYSTSWLNEVLLPDFFSFDKKNQTLKCLSIDCGECGNISYYPLSISDKHKDFKNDLIEYKILKKIQL